MCVTICSAGSYADNLTRKCVLECPKDQNLYADQLLHICSFTCSGGYFGSQINQTCIPVCDSPFYGNPLTTLCVSKCPVKIYSYG